MDSRVVGVVRHHFGRHPAGRSHKAADMRLLHGPLDDARDAEVSDAYGAGPVDEDVASFDVSGGEGGEGRRTGE